MLYRFKIDLVHIKIKTFMKENILVNEQETYALFLQQHLKGPVSKDNILLI